jgi:ankyrin repeat protein
LTNNEGKTALILASGTTKVLSSEKTVELLLENKDIEINIQEDEGWTALMVNNQQNLK